MSVRSCLNSPGIVINRKIVKDKILVHGCHGFMHFAKYCNLVKKTTKIMPAPQRCSRTYTYLHYNNATLQNHHAIQNHTPTCQHSNCHLHHTIHSEYSTLHPALCPHTCIQNIFLPQHHQNREQPTTCHNQQHNIHANPERICLGTNGGPEGGSGGPPPEIEKTCIANGAISVIPELYL